MAPSYKLTYFNGRGLAEKARLCFVASGTEYEDVRLSKEDWPALKPNTPFGKLPMLEVDGKQISESGAIVRYVAKQVGLTGADDWEAAQCDMIDSAIGDLLPSVQGIMRSKEDKEKNEQLRKVFFEETLPALLTSLTKILEANEEGKAWIVGKQLTYADIITYYMVDMVLVNLDKPDVYEKFPLLKAHAERVAAEPKIKEWLEKRPVTEF